jgi:hypothetical protein
MVDDKNHHQQRQGGSQSKKTKKLHRKLRSVMELKNAILFSGKKMKGASLIHVCMHCLGAASRLI